MRLPKTYEPSEYEANIYALWEKAGVFQPKNRGEEGYFSMVLPPPNANGDLHMGQALTVAIEDTLVRYNRLQGRETILIPGADHAGFETWVVYERRLNEQGKSRFDYGREELYKQVWDFVESNKHNFQTQLRALGGSFDWSKFTYTLDDKVVRTAYDTFRKMWHEGLIYRGKRIVNFCTFHGTSFSDIEVVHEEEKTKLWQIAYPLEDGSGEAIIATTRPETKLGQSALMVHPDDKRYKQLVGKNVLQPLVPNTPIPIIADETVEMDFGTGVVTVTPGHDPKDFEVAMKHQLPIIELITIDGMMSDNVPDRFQGLTVMEARKEVAKALAEQGSLRGEEDYTHSIGKCYKCGTPIEPLLREQWFVKMRPLADKAIKALGSHKISFYPDNRREQVIRYLEEVKDWNISRQIPWGIPIPAFQNNEDASDWIFDDRVDQETIEIDGRTYRRDPDVFDTWFSSGHWPQVTLNYPEGEEFKRYYPLSLMETGYDILYPWVARMIMLGLYVTGEIPFKNVYLHGLVLAEDGKKKMSKSLGNVVNPMELVEKYGSDALRMGLLTGRRAGVNQGYHPAKIVAGRNFSNKLWNIARFIEDKVGDNPRTRVQAQPRTAADHWILARLNSTSEEIGSALGHFRLSEAYEALYQFVWGDLADWYVEASKTEINAGLLAYMLETTLVMAHPFAPFVTETIWQTLAWEKDTFLAVQPWPKAIPTDVNAVKEFDEVHKIVSESRQIISALGVKKPALHYQNVSLITGHGELIKRLAGLGGLKEGKATEGLRLTSTPYAIWLDIDRQKAQQYSDKLKEQQMELEAAIKRLDGRLASQDYVSKAPAELVEETRAQLAVEKARLTTLQAEADKFSQHLS